eukprot:31508-Pelagococcus_subviridis.AAC.5
MRVATGLSPPPPRPRPKTKRTSAPTSIARSPPRTSLAFICATTPYSWSSSAAAAAAAAAKSASDAPPRAFDEFESAALPHRSPSDGFGAARLAADAASLSSFSSSLASGSSSFANATRDAVGFPALPSLARRGVVEEQRRRRATAAARAAAADLADEPVRVRQLLDAPELAPGRVRALIREGRRDRVARRPGRAAAAGSHPRRVREPHARRLALVREPVHDDVEDHDVPELETRARVREVDPGELDRIESRGRRRLRG